MSAFTALATKVYKGPVTTVWANSIKANDDYFNTGIARAYCVFDGSTATMTSPVSHNVSNVVDGGAGQYTITFTTAFSSNNYAVLANGVRNDSAASPLAVSSDGAVLQTAASCKIACETLGGVKHDGLFMSVVCFGIGA